MLKKIWVSFLSVVSVVVLGGSDVRAGCIEGETKAAATGYIFTCDTSHPELGEAWRDPSGLLWGDIAMSAVNQNEALEGCFNLNPETERNGIREALDQGRRPRHGYFLPRKDDFKRLAYYLGADGAHKYAPEILPNLTGNWYWSSSSYSDGDNHTKKFYSFRALHIFYAIRTWLGPIDGSGSKIESRCTYQ